MSAFRCLNCGGTYADAMPDRAIYHHACLPLDVNATAKQRREWTPRNENLVLSTFGRMPAIAAEGLGVECLSTPPISEPAWIAELKRKAVKQEEY